MDRELLARIVENSLPQPHASGRRLLPFTDAALPINYFGGSMSGEKDYDKDKPPFESTERRDFQDVGYWQNKTNDRYRASLFHTPNGVMESRPDNVIGRDAMRSLGLPDWQIDKIGSAQAAAAGAADALSFGAFMPALRRLSPDGAATVDGVRSQHPIADTSAQVAGTVLNPANAVFRKGGDALLRAGYSNRAAAGADAASVAGVSMIAPSLEEGAPVGNGVTASMPLAAALTRHMLPRVGNFGQNIAAGVAGGTAAGAVPLAMGDIPGALTSLGAGTMYGAMLPRGRYNPAQKGRLVERIEGPADAMFALGAGQAVYAGMSADEREKKSKVSAVPFEQIPQARYPRGGY